MHVMNIDIYQQHLKEDLLILSLYFIFSFSQCFLFLIYIFSNTHGQRNFTSLIYIAFLLCNVLHSVGNMN